MVLFFNLLPCIKKGKLSFLNTTPAVAGGEGYGDEGGGDDDSINFGNYTIVFTEGLLVSEGEYLGMLSPSVAIQNGNVEIITAKGNKYTRSVSAVSPVCIPSPDFPTSTVILTCTCSVTEVFAKNGESLPSKTYEEKQVKTFKAPNY